MIAPVDATMNSSGSGAPAPGSYSAKDGKLNNWTTILFGPS
ncbi:MAG TPA: hypothetical protein VFG27_03495 [Pseudomonadales bacterium]|nr:hypothetical protein [Pseudomonadales bacterium]